MVFAARDLGLALHNRFDSFFTGGLEESGGVAGPFFLVLKGVLEGEGAMAIGHNEEMDQTYRCCS